MTPYLDLIAGFPVHVTQNIGIVAGVDNGTLGTLESKQFPSEPPTTFRLVQDGTTGAVVQMRSHHPDTRCCDCRVPVL